MQPTLSWGEIHDTYAREHPQYVRDMHPDYGGRGVTMLLGNILTQVSNIFEVGVGPGMNAIYLAKNGHKVEALDVSSVMKGIFQAHAQENNVDIPLVICPAQDYVPEKMYDAFVCTCVLHFMPQEDAIKTIKMMQDYTNPGGYNALEVFSSCITLDRFCPTPQELVNLYPDWQVCKETSSPVRMSSGHETIKLSLLLQKPL